MRDIPFVFKSAIFLSLMLLVSLLLTKTVSATGPSMKFIPNLKTASVGETFTSDIVINTNGAAIGGAGAKIEFDPDVVNIVSVNTGDIFADYPVASFDNNSGKASLSGIVASSSSLYSGEGVFGSVTFRTMKEGNTTVSFDFTPGSTVDSNLAVTYEPGDILNEVGELTVSISGTATASTQTPTPTLSPAFVPSGNEDVSFIDKLLQAIGIKAEDESVLDPYGPIAEQDPKTDPNQRQRYFSSESFRQSRYTFLLIFFSLVAILSIILTAALIYRKRSKSKSSKPPTIHQEL